MGTVSFHRSARLLAAAILIAAAACGGGDDYSLGPDPDPTPVQTASIGATPANRFTPNRVDLLRGGTVTFVFGSVAHNVFFDGASDGAPENITGARINQSIEVPFGTAGTFVYNCHIHAGMSGTVVVQ